MCYKTVFSLTALALATHTAAATPSLFISEYIEGKGFNKAIELFNGGKETLDLSQFTLKKYINGKNSSSHDYPLTGQLAPGKTFVLVHQQAEKALTDKASVVKKHNILNFNGDDPIALYHHNTQIDLVGEFGGQSFGKDQQLIRLTQQASDTYNTSDWQIISARSAQEMAKTLGNHSADTQPKPQISCTTGTPRLISQIQGSGNKSPLVPEGKYEGPEVIVEGIVTQTTPNRFKGFFIQEESWDSDGNPATSEGIFVYGQAPGLTVGEKVRVKGKVKEYYNQTQLDLVAYSKCGLQQEVIQPLQVSADTPLQALESYEGMLVNWSGNSALKVTKNFSFNYTSFRNEMVLSKDQPLYKPTQLFPALSKEAQTLASSNKQQSITIETDVSKQTNGVISYFPDFGPYQNYIRIGDTLQNITGVIQYSYGRYGVIPTVTLSGSDFDHQEYPRTDTPQLTQEGNLKVASFNVLNYFNRVVPDAADNAANNSNRGATKLDDFYLQRTKIVNAITRMDADIIGLMEIENNGFSENSAIYDLVTALNAQQTDKNNNYQFVSTPAGGFIGSDAITVGLLFRPSKVALKGQPSIIPMPEQHFTLTTTENKQKTITKQQRHTLVQSFKHLTSGETLTIAVNHFKSKGSMCFEDYQEYAVDGKVALDGKNKVKGKPAPGYVDDLQGSCNEFRVSAAVHLAQHLTSKPQQYGSNILLIGDFNAYAQEDPMRVLTDYTGKEQRLIQTAKHTSLEGKTWRPFATVPNGFGFVDLTREHHGLKSFSYSFDGELGSLDHALASTTLAKKVKDITHWHINSLENSLFEYSKKYSGQLPKSEDHFSASDHDPLLLSISFTEKKTTKETLNQLISSAWTHYKKVVRAPLGTYPIHTQMKLMQALFFALEVQNNSMASEQYIQQAVSRLQHAIATLQHPMTAVNKAGLSAVVQIAESLLQQANNTYRLWYYPKTAIQQMDEFILHAKNILTNDQVNQSKVNNTTLKLLQKITWFSSQRRINFNFSFFVLR
ncbi:ExeM/NucH family extracellular endonuclease [Zooshikella harenae]|uniref:ExeM/NucH family extracellular endonuclease n=1 Tax=Zooshikella harenae TaxID=2827238 RepID=A0ABS5ZC77_9GAMM|nr:ExeM/NucH family extracellular endonuclease [Zooshikella harenae]MBU2711599.1 ExeM/NucH family extracellular endonuclease [Zooshikella harenae]